MIVDLKGLEELSTGVGFSPLPYFFLGGFSPLPLMACRI